MPSTIKNNQRMYLKPLQASEKFFLPDPSNYFSGGLAKDSSKSKSNSKSDSAENKPNTAMFLHGVRLDQEKQTIASAQSRLESKAIDLLTNKYNGDVSEFQRGEYREFEQGKGFYADMSEMQQKQSLYRANKFTAEVEYKKWQAMLDKATSDEALNMVIEDEYNQPMRAGQDGNIYQITQNSKGGLVYRSANGKTMTKEQGDSLPYVTMSDYLQKTFMDTDYENGTAMGPANYYESYDFKEKPFSTELDKIMAIAKSNKSGGSTTNEYLVGKNQIPMDATAAQSVADSWVFLKETSGSVSSNVSAINAAVNNVYSALSEEGRRDLRQQWYKAKKSGQQYASPPDINGEVKVQSGEDLPIETFVYNLAAGKAPYQYEQTSTQSSTFQMLNDFNKDDGGGPGSEKVTSLATWLNPAIIMGQGDSQVMSFVNKDEDSKDGYSFVQMETPILQADPFLTRQLNEALIPTSSTGERNFPTTESLGIKEALAPNGQFVDVSDANTELVNVTGRSALFPMYEMQDGKPTENIQYEIKYGENNKPYKDVAKEQYLEIEVKVADVKKFRRKQNYYDLEEQPSNLEYVVEGLARYNMYDVEGLHEMNTITAPKGSKSLKKFQNPSSNYIEHQFGMDYSGYINKDGNMKIWVKANSVTSGTSGTNVKAETSGNANLIMRQIQASEMNNIISNLAR